MCDVIKIRIKRRDATIIKLDEKIHIKFCNPSFKIGHFTAVLLFSGLFPFPFLVAILLFRSIFMTSHMTLTSTSNIQVEEALITGLRPAMLYQVRVFAENELGRSKEGRVLQVLSFNILNSSRTTLFNKTNI